MTERAKVDELLTKVQNTMLSAAVAQLRYQLNTVGISFTVAANHLNSEISQTSDYQLARKISAYSSGGRGTGRGGRFIGRGGRFAGRGRSGRGGRGPNEKTSNTLRRNGKSCRLKSATKFAKNVTRKASKMEPSETFQN